MKKIILGLGTLGAIVAPVTIASACGKTKAPTKYEYRGQVFTTSDQAMKAASLKAVTTGYNKDGIYYEVIPSSEVLDQDYIAVTSGFVKDGEYQISQPVIVDNSWTHITDTIWVAMDGSSFTRTKPAQVPESGWTELSQALSAGEHFYVNAQNLGVLTATPGYTEVTTGFVKQSGNDFLYVAQVPMADDPMWIETHGGWTKGTDFRDTSPNSPDTSWTAVTTGFAKDDGVKITYSLTQPKQQVDSAAYVPVTSGFIFGNKYYPTLVDAFNDLKIKTI